MGSVTAHTKGQFCFAYFPFYYSFFYSFMFLTLLFCVTRYQYLRTNTTTLKKYQKHTIDIILFLFLPCRGLFICSVPVFCPLHSVCLSSSALSAMGQAPAAGRRKWNTGNMETVLFEKDTKWQLALSPFLISRILRPSARPSPREPRLHHTPFRVAQGKTSCAPSSILCLLYTLFPFIFY